MYRRWHLVALLIFVLLTVGCGKTAEPPGEALEQKKKDNRLVAVEVAATENIDSLDPLEINSPLEFQIAENIYQRLVTTDNTGQFVPQLAQEIAGTENEDGVVFILKEGMQFHDGAAVTATAVKDSLDRWLTTYGDVTKSPVKALQVIDDYKLVVLWRDGREQLLAALSGMRASIISPTAVEGGVIAGGTYFEPAKIDIGTGPYLVQEWVKGQWLTLTTYPNSAGEIPPVSRWKIRLSVPAEDALLDFQGNKVDVVQGMHPQLVTVGYDMGLSDRLKLNKLAAGAYLQLDRSVFNEQLAVKSVLGLIDKDKVSQRLAGLHLPLESYLPVSQSEQPTVSGAVYAEGAAVLFELGLTRFTLTPTDVPSPMAREIVQELIDKGLEVEPVEQSDSDAAVRLLIWTMPTVNQESLPALWREMGINIDVFNQPQEKQDNSQAVTQQQLADSGQLVPLLALRQATYLSQQDMPLSKWGYLDLSSFQPQLSE